MTNNIISLKETKDVKKAKILVQDLDKIIHIMNLSIQSLSYYKKYIPVMETISSLQNNKTLIEIHNNKLKKFLESKK